MTTVSMMDFLMGSKKHRSLMSVLLGNFKLNDPPVGVHAVPVIHRLGAVIKRANEGKPIDRVALADCVFHSSLLNQAAVRVPVLVADRTTGVTDFLAVVRGPLDDVGREKVGVLARGSAIAPSKREALGRRLQVREERFERLDRRAEAADAGAQLVVDVGKGVGVKLEPGPVAPINHDLDVEQGKGRDVVDAQAWREG